MAQHDPLVAGSLGALLQCLEDEYRALLADDATQLESVLARKEHLLAQLAADPGIALGPARGRPDAVATGTLTRARELNQRNALVLAPRAAANRARLRCLQSALGGVALYAADGQAAPAGAPAGARRSA